MASAAAATTAAAAVSSSSSRRSSPDTSIPSSRSLSFSRKPLRLRRHLLHPSSLLALPQHAAQEEEPVFFDFDKPREECGVVGVIGDDEASRLCSLALHALQHRGQEGAGIASASVGGHRHLHRVAGIGLVSEVFSSPSTVASLPGAAAIGHVRYSTAGAAASEANVQPLLAGYRFGEVAVAHNGNLVNYNSLRHQLESRGSIFKSSSDTEVILHLIAISSSRPFVARLAEALESLEGAYSFLFLTPTKLFAARDPFGFRPLVLGRRKQADGRSAVVFASETCALDLIGADYEREVMPGEIIEVDSSDLTIKSSCLLPPKPRKACVFEHVYFALPNSIVFGLPVHESRYQFGAALAAESPVPGADVVIPVPDSGFFAALGFAERSGVPFQQGLIRSHYVGRTFIQPSQEIRDLGVKLKLAPVRGILKDKSVVVVDDSIVRGTTSSKIVRLIRDAGAREVHMRIASPPITGSCYYGVDTPRSEELVSNRMDVEGVRKLVGADSLAFLRLESLHDAVGGEEQGFCDACFSGKYPVAPKENEATSAFEEQLDD